MFRILNCEEKKVYPRLCLLLKLGKYSLPGTLLAQVVCPDLLPHPWFQCFSQNNNNNNSWEQGPLPLFLPVPLDSLDPGQERCNFPVLSCVVIWHWLFLNLFFIYLVRNSFLPWKFWIKVRRPELKAFKLPNLSKISLGLSWAFKELMLSNCGAGEDSESPLDSKEIKPVNPKGNQPWIFIGRTDAEIPILWPPDVKSRLIGKDPDVGKDRRQKEKGSAENEMVR